MSGTQIFPNYPVSPSNLSGPVYTMFADDGPAVRLDFVLTQTPAINDVLRIGWAIQRIEGEDLRVYHGNTLVDTQPGVGISEVNHTCDNTSNVLNFRSGGAGLYVDTLVGAISVIRNP